MSGILLVDKPQDWTSFDVVAKLKRVYHTGRIGHSGTLDPLATGLLCIFIGRATRAVSFAEAQQKRYIAHLRLGIVTDTQDITGTVLEEHPSKTGREELEAVLSRFVGEIEQIPPMYSAIKVNGQRLYDLARKGKEVERKARKITIHALRLCGEENGDYILDVTCSKGTYIRTLCHDIGQTLGCGACMSALRRIEVGDYSVERAYTMQEILAAAERGEEETLLMSVDSLFSETAEYIATENEERKLRCGNELHTRLPDGGYRVYAPSGEFLALSEAAGGILRTVRSFYEVD